MNILNHFNLKNKKKKTTTLHFKLKRIYLLFVENVKQLNDNGGGTHYFTSPCDGDLVNTVSEITTRDKLQGLQSKIFIMKQSSRFQSQASL